MITGLENVERTVSIPGNTTQSILVTCTPDSGKKVLGGGFELLANNMQVIASCPNVVGDMLAEGWLAVVRNDNSGPADAKAWAICALVDEE